MYREVFQTPWLKFVVSTRPSGNRKTPIYKVMPAADDPTNTFQPLGFVSWYGPWRRYTFTPEPHTVYDAACLVAIADFCKLLMTERKEAKDSSLTGDYRSDS